MAQVKEFVFDGIKTGYMVSDEGYVIGKHGKKKKTYITASGYHRMKIYINGKEYMLYLHRIVAMTFCDNPDNNPEAAHQYHDKDNNRADNLKWQTRAENACKYAFKRKLSHDNVREIRKLLKSGMSVRKIASKYDVDGSTIFQIKTNKIHKGVA